MSPKTPPVLTVPKGGVETPPRRSCEYIVDLAARLCVTHLWTTKLSTAEERDSELVRIVPWRKLYPPLRDTLFDLPSAAYKSRCTPDEAMSKMRTLVRSVTGETADSLLLAVIEVAAYARPANELTMEKHLADIDMLIQAAFPDWTR